MKVFFTQLLSPSYLATWRESRPSFRLLAGLIVLLAGVPATTLFGQASSTHRKAPFAIRFEAGKRSPDANAPQLFKQYLKLGANDRLVKIKTERDPKGFTHEKYEQHYKGIRVEYGLLKTHSRKGAIESITGEQYAIPETGVQPQLSESAALQKAMAFVGAKTYLWQNAQEEAWIKKEQNNPKATLFPKAELVICRDFLHRLEEEKMVLAYKFDIYATEPLSRAYIYVDASNGQVIHQNSILRDADGTAETRYSGTRTIQADLSGANYVLRDASRGGGVETYNLQKTQNFATAIDFSDADNNWTALEFDNANKDNAALDAHWGAQKVYDYWKNVHGRLGLDNLNGKMKGYVHYGNNIDNAYWDGTAMLYGDGNTRFRALTSLDVVAHEFGHGVMQYTADLIYSYEQGALNEGFSDIWGAVIEHYAAPEKQNWLIGEEIALTAPALRSMSDPNSGSPQQPDTYKGTYWYTSTGDNGGVHYNSGVLNFWFYLLTEGKTGTNDNGSNYAVTGIGIDKAAQIAYRTESVYLTSTSNYQDTRMASLLAAIDLFGENSNEVIQTKNAWDAVGLSEPITLTLSAVSDTEIGLSWQVSSANITGFEVERSLSPNSGFAFVATLAGNINSYTDAALVTSTTYYYRIKATQANGSFYYSPVKDLFLGIPASPTLLVANVSGNTVNLSWQDNSFNETNFLLERSLNASSGFALIATLDPNTTSYQDNPVVNIYYYRVRAYRSDLSFYSAYSNTVRVIHGNITIMSNDAVITCDQLYLDPGGNDNYSDNQRFTQTFTPATENAALQVVFTAFNTEDGYDFLYIYDGANISAPLIGSYTGTNSPGTIIAHNPTGQLTFRFTSDESLTRPGWSANFSCVPTPLAPNQLVSGNEDSAIPVTLEASWSTALTYNLLTLPTHGTLSGTAPNLTYTPEANYFGPDSLTYFVTADGFTSRVATVHLTVNPVNDAPSFVKGADQLIPGNAGLQTVNGWATSRSAGPANEAGQSLAFTTLANQTSLFSVQPAVSSDGTLTYTPALNTTGTTTVSLTLQDDGGTANGGINSSTQTFTITINPILFVTAAAQNKPYGSANPALTFSYSGFTNGENEGVLDTPPTISTTATTSSDAGNYPITVSGGLDDKYSFVYVNASLTVNKKTLTTTADAKNKLYGADVPALTFGYAGFVNGDDAADLDTAPTIATTATASSHVGNYGITLSGGLDNNYEFAFENSTLSIGKATLTATADNKNRAYGVANPVLTISYTGFVNGDHATDLDGQPLASTTAVLNSPSGDYPITLAGGEDNDYLFSLVSGTLSVGKTPLTVKASNQSKTYGEDNPALTFSYSGFVDGDNENVLDTAPTAATTATASSGASSYPITLSGGADNKYSFLYENAILIVNQASLTATAENKSRPFGTANPALTISYTGFVNGEESTVLDSQPVAATSASVNSPVGNYPITLSGGTDNNYALLLQAGTLTVSAAPTSTQVVSFTLVNADTDQDLQTLTNGATLNLATLPTHNLNIRANCSTVRVYRVVFNLSGKQSRTATEEGAPYALFGDKNGDYNAWVPAVGNYSLKATPFSTAAGTALTIAFSVINQPSTNHLPVVANAIPNQTATVNAPFSFSFAVNTFSDSDGNALTYSASLSSNAALPAWLSFQAASRTFSGTPPSTSGSPFTIQVTASDGSLQTSTPFTLTVSPAPSGPQVVSFTLVNADTDQDIQLLANGATLNLASLPTHNLNIRANTSPAKVGSVVFNLTGKQVRNFTEGGAPYALFGDNNGNYKAWTPAPAVGSYTLKGTPFTAGGGGGTPGSALTISFTIINQAARLAVSEAVVEGLELMAYPNPTPDGHLKIALSQALSGSVSYVLVHQTGVILTEGKVELREPTSVISFDFSNQMQGAGVYYLRLEGNQLKGFLKLDRQ